MSGVRLRCLMKDNPAEAASLNDRPFLDLLIGFAWRIPFLCGALVAGVGYMIRRNLQVETLTVESKRPLRDTFGRNRWPVVRIILLNVSTAVAYYVMFVYAVTYIRKIDQLPESIALDLNTGATAALLLVYPLAAWLSDRYGRKPLIITGSAVLTFAAIPLFHLAHGIHPATIALGEIGFVIGNGILIGGLVATYAELIPRAVRCTGVAFAYNMAMAVFGGTAPLVAAWLITETGDPIAPAYWVTIASAISLLTAIFLTPETRHRALDEWPTRDPVLSV